MNLKHLINYLTDECSEQEKKAVEQWINSDLTNKQYIESLKRIWNVAPEDEFKVDAERSWNSFKENVLKEEKSLSRFKKIQRFRNKKKRGEKYFYLNIAAAAAIAFIVLLFLNEVNFGNEPVAKEQFKTQEIVTEKGEKIRIKLTDGTHVILNSDSKLKIPSQFIGESREVHLSGEAYFEVTHQQGKPFVVHSNKSLTKVLGTQFVVSAYSTDENVLVAVTEGKVSMEAKGMNKSNPKIIQKGFVGKLQRGGATTITMEDNLEMYTGWTNKKLIFENDPFKEVKNRIERWYDITIVVKDTLIYKRHLTAKFMNEPLEEVLKVSSLSMDVGYKKEKRKVTFFDNE